MSRLFYALWPDPKTRRKLSTLSKDIHRGRVIEPQNLHITLLFLGKVDETIRQRLLDMTADISINQFQLQLLKSEWWKRSGILCLAPDTIPEQLLHLTARLTDIAHGCNLSVEDRTYRPHVTLARKITRPMNIDFEPFSWKAGDFSLLESVTLPQGAEYKIIHTWPLT